MCELHSMPTSMMSLHSPLVTICPLTLVRALPLGHRVVGECSPHSWSPDKFCILVVGESAVIERLILVLGLGSVGHAITSGDPYRQTHHYQQLLQHLLFVNVKVLKVYIQCKVDCFKICQQNHFFVFVPSLYIAPPLPICKCLDRLNKCVTICHCATW